MDVRLVWKSYYGNEPLTLQLPDEWDAQVSGMPPRQPLSDAAIADRIAQAPVRSGRLRDLARGKRRVVIAVDDLTRPTEAHRLAPPVLSELAAAGVEARHIVFLVAMGTHRPYTLPDLRKKLGEEIVQTYAVSNHSCYQHHRLIGRTCRGTPVQINQTYLDADLKIGIGTVMPHPIAGFSGGGKLVTIGLGGIDTVEGLHRPALTSLQGTIGRVEGNPVREEIEEGLRLAGLDFLVNTVQTSTGATAEVFAGEPAAAYADAVRAAQQAYACDVRYQNDVGIFNTFPRDTWMLMSFTSLNVWSTRSPEKAVVRPGGSIVIVNAASEGVGEHGLMTKGMRQYRLRDQHGTFKDMLRDRELVFLSPNITRAMIRDYYQCEVQLVRDGDALVRSLRRRHPGRARVSVFPHGPLQMDGSCLTPAPAVSSVARG